jgi:hypothetical protein
MYYYTPAYHEQNRYVITPDLAWQKLLPFSKIAFVL